MAVDGSNGEVLGCYCSAATRSIPYPPLSPPPLQPVIQGNDSDGDKIAAHCGAMMAVATTAVATMDTRLVLVLSYLSVVCVVGVLSS